VANPAPWVYLYHKVGPDNRENTTVHTLHNTVLDSELSDIVYNSLSIGFVIGCGLGMYLSILGDAMPGLSGGRSKDSGSQTWMTEVWIMRPGYIYLGDNRCCWKGMIGVAVVIVGWR